LQLELVSIGTLEVQRVMREVVVG